MCYQPYDTPQSLPKKQYYSLFVILKIIPNFGLLNYKFADAAIDHNESCCKLNRSELKDDYSESFLFEESYFYDIDSESNSPKQENENKRKMSDSGNDDHQTKKPKQDLFSKFEDEIFSSSSSSNVTNH